MDSANDFFTWLSAQPACVAVSVGVFFCLVVAPAILAFIAMAVTRLESIVEMHLARHVGEGGPIAACRPSTSTPALSGRT